MPDPYSGDNPDIDIEEFLGRFRKWLLLHNDKFNNDAAKVARIKYVLAGTALQWYNNLHVGGIPVTLNNLQCDFYTKFSIAKTRQE